MLQQLVSFLAFCCVSLAAFGLGRSILRGLGVGQDDRLSVAVWSIALGLVAWGLLILGLGLLGILYVPVIGVLTMAGCFWGLGEILRGQLSAAQRRDSLAEGVEPQPADRPQQTPWPPPPRWLLGGVLLASGIAVLGSLAGALAPPTAGDALCYHLELPKTFLLEHRIAHLPYHDNATYPLLTEMWYLWGLALDCGVCAQLVHWGLGILLALATVVLCRPIVGRPWGLVAGAVVLLTPGVNNQMTAPLNDVALAVMTTLALAAWWRAVVGEEDRRWFLVAGLTAGGALGTKYIALVFATAVALTWLWAVARRPQRRRLLLWGAAVVGVVAVSTGGVWYARAAWHRGNPVYPFLAEAFAEDGRTATPELPATPNLPVTLPDRKAPLGRGPMAVATAGWQITMHPERFGGRGHQLGVLLLAALPGLLFARRLRGLGTVLAVAGVYFVLWCLLRQNVRFLLPVVPLLAVGVVWVWIEMVRLPSRPRQVAAAAFAVVLAAMAAVAAVRSRHQFAVAVGWQDRGEYLARHEPTYTAAAVANALADPQAHVLSQDYRAFYFDCRVTRESIYRRHTGYDKHVTDPTCFSRQLQQAGFTHLLLAETLNGDRIGFDPTLARLADAQLATDAADDLFTLTKYVFRDADGTLRQYRLVMLRDAGVGR